MVKNVTVLRTEVSPDLKAARVYVSVMGDEKAQSLAMHGLRSARGFIQSQIADRLELRYTPILSFVLDPGVKLSIETSSIIRQALTSTAAGATADEDSAAGNESDAAESTRDEMTGEESAAAETDGRAGEDRQEAFDRVDAGRLDSGQAGDVPGSELEKTIESTGN